MLACVCHSHEQSCSSPHNHALPGLAVEIISVIEQITAVRIEHNELVVAPNGGSSERDRQV